MPPPLPTTTADSRLPAGGTTYNGSPQYVFPADLDKMEYWIRFSPFQYTRASRNSPATPGPLLGSIFLPVPSTLATSYGADWSQTELGVLGDYVAGLSKDVQRTMAQALGSAKIQGGDTLSTVGDLLMNNTWKQIEEGRGATALANLGFTVDTYLVGGGISVGTGLQRNPHMALLFTGVKFRTHQFQYHFVAKSSQEAETLHGIIRMFKYCMHPSYENLNTQSQGNDLFRYPDEWEIDLAFPNTFGFQYCVLTDFQVNYHGEGVPAYHEDRWPVSVTLGLNFQETNILTKEDIGLGYG